MAQYIEDVLPPIRDVGLNTQENVLIEGSLEVDGGIVGQEQIVTAVSNGTTAVSVFGASGLPYAIDITGVYLISRDTTATNVTVEAPASTVVSTIAKGTAAGALVGASSLANNTSIAAGTDVILDGSGAGVAQVFITFKRSA
jgi:hypothetical protein